MKFESWIDGRVKFVSFGGCCVLGGLDCVVWFCFLTGRCLIECRGEFRAGYVCEIVLGMGWMLIMIC